MRLFNATITPTMLYGSGSWAMTSERRQRVRATQRRMMRTILGRHWKPGEDYVDWIKAATEEAEQTMRKHNVPDWVTLQQRRMRQWAGKVARSNDGRWSHEVLFWSPGGKRNQGRPFTRWSDHIVAFLRQTFGQEVGELDCLPLAADEKLRINLEDQFCRFMAEPY